MLNLLRELIERGCSVTLSLTMASIPSKNELASIIVL